MVSLAADPRDVEFSRLRGTYCCPSRLEHVHAVIVGGGALGSEAVRLLGLMGAGAVDVVDPDCVEASNVIRSVFFAGRMGANKAGALVEGARPVFPRTRFRAFSREIADVGFEDLRDATVVLSCTDSTLARLETAYVGTRLNLPVVDAGVAPGDLSYGRVAYLPGREGACFGCLLTARRRAELLTMWESEAQPCWAEGDAAESTTASPMLASTIASLQVEMALRGAAEGWTSSWSWTVQTYPQPGMERLELARSIDCPFHDADGERMAAPGDQITVRNLATNF